MGPLEARVKDRIPVCINCGRLMLDMSRASRELVRVSDTSLTVLYKHRKGGCRAAKAYLKNRQEEESAE